RIKALMRRKNMGASPGSAVIELGNLKIDPERFEVTMNGEALTLAKKEFEILMLLSSQPGKVFSRDEIFRRVWGYSESIASRTIDVHISKLRDKIGGDMIRTLKGVGYKLDI
ncbi:MAG: response regulator transcription factor, partial [Saprospiraceae bacterium]|nr:response regulator transcription factor [Saprospiraceae bacterium]